MNTFRILSLDGGGIKGSFTVSFLATIEGRTGKAVVDHFDLITGTSTGGIIAIGLGLGMPAAEIQEFYEKEGPKIFPSIGVTRSTYYKIRHFLGPKYASRPLQIALQRVFENKRLGHSKVRLVIPSYDLVRGDVHLFKTAHHEKFKEDYQCPAWEVAMATAAAPTYFPAFASSSGVNLADGGIWAANPVMVSIVEAQSLLSQDLSRVSVLSIGTTESPFTVSKLYRKRGGILLWNKRLIDLMMHAQSRACLAQAKLLLGDRFLRINPTVNDWQYSLDKADSIDDLIALGHAEARQREKEISRLFLSTRAEQFVPLYSLS